MCPICSEKFKKLTGSHFRYKHHLSNTEFVKRYPNVDRGMIPWNIDKTKLTHPSVLKISKTMAAKPISNFANWHKLRKQSSNYNIKKSKNLAELIGIILGDGSMQRFPRTERLVITCNASEKQYVKHIYNLIKKVFSKNPSLTVRKREKAIDISLYQCNISNRLEIPFGNKIRNAVSIPEWIYKTKIYTIACLKGLFETDGCFQRDDSNYAQYIEVKSYCKQLRKDIYKSLLLLGYNPQLGKKYVRLARRDEVHRFKKSIKFREY